MGDTKASKRKNKTGREHQPQRRTHTASASKWSANLWQAGVLIGVGGVPAAMWVGCRNPFGPPKLAVLAAAAALVCIGLALDADARSRLIMIARLSPVAWTFAGLVSVGMLATITSVDVRQSLLGNYPDYRGMLTVVACLAVGAGSAVLSNQRTAVARERFWRGIVLVSLGIGIFAALQRVGLVPAGAKGFFREGMRISSTLGNSSNYGVYLVTVLPILAWRCVSERSAHWRWASGGALALAVLSLFWTLSRGAWIAALIVLVVWLFLFLVTERDRSRVRSMGLLAAGLVGLSLVGMMLTPGFQDRAAQILDAGSRTAAWRLSAWRSSWRMTLDRPVLGWGPNTYRLVYPRYQEPGQITGVRGYTTIESAHNVLFDVSTSAGFAGVVALVAFCAAVGHRLTQEMRRCRSALGPVIVAFVGLFGGFVAAQFHYVTMDTGPLIAALIGVVAASEADSGIRVPREVSVRIAPAIGSVGSLYVVVLVGALALVRADVLVAQARGLEAAGAPWQLVQERFLEASRLAPWEPQVIRAMGTGATRRILKKGFDPLVLRDGLTAFDTVARKTPLDAGVVAERANLLLAAGMRSRDQQLLAQAVDGFTQAIRMDPNTGIPRAGRGAALLALGRTGSAIADLEIAVALSPQDRTARRNLALAYERAGRTDEARRARKRAKK